MSLLLPLGLLGLLGLVALLLIYILKPNYMQKSVSSTYLWKRSLKRKKKTIPISQLRQILLIICQVLVITACALILSKPAVLDTAYSGTESIFVIDASAGMRTKGSNDTRFERAVGRVIEDSVAVIDGGGLVSVIFADNDPALLASRCGKDRKEEVLDALNALLDDDACTYGDADITGAMSLAEPIMLANSNAHLYLYTGTKYLNAGSAEVVNVSEDGEWNAAILDAKAIVVDNRYQFSVQIASYGFDTRLSIACQVTGVDGDPKKVAYSVIANEQFSNDEVKTVTFSLFSSVEPTGSRFEEWTEPVSAEESVMVNTYASARIYFGDVKDSLAEDNSFVVYGGTKPTIRIQYASTQANIFMAGALMTLRSTLADRYEIDFVEVKGSGYATSGFDYYIFENDMPEILPSDGAVWLVFPNRAPIKSGFEFQGYAPMVNQNLYTMSAGTPHEITRRVIPESIQMTTYSKIRVNNGSDYKVLLTCGDDPALILREADYGSEDKVPPVAVLTASVNYSYLGLTSSFGFLFLHMFNYFFPSTLTEFAFDVNEAIAVNARGSDLTLRGPNIEEKIETVPATISMTIPGTYSLTQMGIYKEGRGEEEIVDYFYVKISSTQSHINRTEDYLETPVIEVKEEDRILEDLLLWFAIALVALLFVERILASRDKI